MDGEISLDRSVGNVMKLDDNEQALMDEIEIQAPRPRSSRRVPQPTVYKPQPQPTMQEDIDAFANPTKQSAPQQHQEEPVDYGEYDEEEMEQPQYMQGDYAIQEEERPSPGYNLSMKRRQTLSINLVVSKRRDFR